MSRRQSTKEAVSTKIVSFFAARPWLLAFLLMLAVSVTTQGVLLEDGGSWAVEPGVLNDGDADTGP